MVETRQSGCHFPILFPFSPLYYILYKKMIRFMDFTFCIVLQCFKVTCCFLAIRIAGWWWGLQKYGSWYIYWIYYFHQRNWYFYLWVSLLTIENLQFVFCLVASGTQWWKYLVLQILTPFLLCSIGLKFMSNIFLSRV